MQVSLSLFIAEGGYQAISYCVFAFGMPEFIGLDAGCKVFRYLSYSLSGVVGSVSDVVVSIFSAVVFINTVVDYGSQKIAELHLFSMT